MDLNSSNRDKITKMSSDNIIKKKVGSTKIYINLSHKLPEYIKKFPFYDRALSRICKDLSQIDGHLTLIDIGANIGDTVALITENNSGKFLCIEGDKKYLPLLRKNVGLLDKKSYFEIAPYYCGEVNNRKNKYSINNQGGTARLVPNGIDKLSILSLDEILNKNTKFKKANIIKIDTDGFETSVIKGAKELLLNQHPMVFFEYTPDLYKEQNIETFAVLEILLSYGYKKALFYTNFGYPKKIIDLSDKREVQKLIDLIDHNKIFYYDILTFHSSDKKYENIFELELLDHAEYSRDITTNSYLKINELQEKVKTLNKNKITTEFLEKENHDLKIKNKYLLRVNNKLRDKYKKQQIEKDLQVELNNEHLMSINKLNLDLNKIYNSKLWKVATKLYTVKDRLSAILELISIKQSSIFQFSKRWNTSSSKKVIFIDHSYHKKTLSTKFIIDILKKYFEVEILWDDSWQGKEFPDISFVDEKYLGVIFFQNLPTANIFNRIKNKNRIFIPMYDCSGGQPITWWKSYNYLKVINFSSTLHKKLIDWKINSIYVQRFPKPEKFTPGNPKDTFFYCRVNSINFNVVKTLVGHLKSKIHVHKTIDPGHTFIAPSKEDHHKFSISYSSWFKNKADQWKAADDYGIFIAPRPFEGIGQGFIEAMARGKAVISPNNPTMNEYIEHNKNGYLYDMSNPTPIDFSNIEQIQVNAYKYIVNGWKRWKKDKLKIVEFIKS
jgi:FkbM family methyltransferase